MYKQITHPVRRQLMTPVMRGLSAFTALFATFIVGVMVLNSPSLQADEAKGNESKIGSIQFNGEGYFRYQVIQVKHANDDWPDECRINGVGYAYIYDARMAEMAVESMTSDLTLTWYYKIVIDPDWSGVEDRTICEMYSGSLHE